MEKKVGLLVTALRLGCPFTDFCIRTIITLSSECEERYTQNNISRKAGCVATDYIFFLNLLIELRRKDQLPSTCAVTQQQQPQSDA